MKKGCCAVLGAIVLTVSGCSSWHPLVPTAVAAAHPPKPPLLGVDLYSVRNYSTATVRRDGARDVAYLKSLGVQTIGLAWNLYQPSSTSNKVYASKRRSLSASNVALLTRIVEQAGLSVEYRPMLKCCPTSTRPTNIKRWFDSLLTAETPYLRIAQRYRVGEFVTATELVTLNVNPHWGPFLRQVRREYHGTVSYAEIGGHFFSSTPDLLPITEYGVTAYPRVRLPDNATVRQLTRAWLSFLRREPESVLEHTAIDEIGIPAETHAYRKPWYWKFTPGRKLDEAVQARWYTAACRATEATHMRAIYFWNANLADNPARPPFPDYPAFEGKKGASAIRGCLKILQAAGQ